MSLLQIMLILIFNNSGADGKSTWAEMLSCIASLLGLRPAVLDVDPGNHGFHLRGGTGLELDWDSSIGSGAAAEAWFQKHLGGRRLIIVDTGANFLSLGAGAGSEGAEVVRVVGEIVEIVRRAGGRLIVHAVTSPNKPGSGELVRNIYERFSGHGEVAIVRNNRDGSQNFSREIEALQADVIDVPYIAPGLQAYRLSRPEPLEEVLCRPSSGYSAASGALAQIVRTVARHPHVRSIVGSSADEAFERLCIRDVGHLLMAVRTIQDARDEILLANARLSRAWAAFFEADFPNRDWVDDMFFLDNWKTFFRPARRARREFFDAAREFWMAKLEWEEATYEVREPRNEG